MRRRRQPETVIERVYRKWKRSQTYVLILTVFVVIGVVGYFKHQDDVVQPRIKEEINLKDKEQSESSKIGQKESTDKDVQETIDGSNGNYSYDNYSRAEHYEGDVTAHKQQESVQKNKPAEQTRKENNPVSATKGNFTSQGAVIPAPNNVPSIVKAEINNGIDVPTFIDSHLGYRVFQLKEGRVNVLVETEYTTPAGKEYIKDQVNSGKMTETFDGPAGLIFYTESR